MANPFYQPGTERAARVNDLFGAIAQRYDLINDLQSFGLHRLWKRRMAVLARIPAGGLALDLCCGTGDIAFALARRGATVCALDFSAPMLAVAAHRLHRTPPDVVPGRVDFLRADALRIPFPDNYFDAVTIGYGLRNLASVEAGLAEMWRVAKPGGRILVLDFGKPEHPLWRAAYFLYLKCLVPAYGRVLCRNAEAYAYILESLRHYPAQQGVAALMRKQPSANVAVVNFLGGMMSINHAEKA